MEAVRDEPGRVAFRALVKERFRITVVSRGCAWNVAKRSSEHQTDVLVCECKEWRAKAEQAALL
jgi:hypothetical protein